MEKRIGEHSTRQSLPESWKWQRRYWVLSEPKGLLYYFKSADDPPQYRGIINIRECRVEDVDANGMPKTSGRSKYDLDGGGGTVSLLIKVSHKVRDLYISPTCYSLVHSQFWGKQIVLLSVSQKVILKLVHLYLWILIWVPCGLCKNHFWLLVAWTLPTDSIHVTQALMLPDRYSFECIFFITLAIVHHVPNCWSHQLQYPRDC